MQSPSCIAIKVPKPIISTISTASKTKKLVMATPIVITLVATPIVNFLMEKLTSKAWSELKNLWGVKTNELEGKLEEIMGVLEEAEARGVPMEPRPAMQRWLNKLKDAAYDADDVIHECQAEALRQHKVESNITDFLLDKNNFPFARRMNKKVEGAMKILVEIMEDKQWSLLKDGSARGTETLDFGRKTSSELIDPLIYGRDEDKEKIASYLMNEENDKEVSVLSIVGLGGVGKTTLARFVYHEEGINRLFNQKLWIWVSAEFSVEGILRKIIELLTENVCVLSQIETMQQKLKGLLNGKRFLLVLDDVWNMDERQWTEVLTYLKAGRKGSKILVTTRCLSVAMMCSTVTYPLKGLSDNYCWEIFNNRAFGGGRTENSARLEVIGKEVVEKCGGLPLAADSLGRLMGAERGEACWSNVRQTELWRLPEDKTKILSALKLSYYRMPSHLKQCFAYCSLFPKDYKIYKEKLISLWVAEGFIPTLVADTLEENIDESCIDRLLDIYFLQDAVDHNHHDRVIAYEMHDVVQDLAWSVAGDEFLFVSGATLCFKKSSSNSSYRYLSLIHDGLSFDTLNASSGIEKVRSLISLPLESNARCSLKKSSWELLKRLSLLRVLDLSYADISELPNMVSKLQQLRLLNLSNTKIRTLPSTIVGLQYLFTLKLSNCTQLKELPDGISNMSNLMLLDIYGCDNLIRMPARIGRLTQLCSLTMFVVSNNDRLNDGHTIKELKNMNLIRGRLQIKDLHKLKNRGEAEAANLQEKKDLRQLELFWRGDCQNVDDVFEGLQPCRYLDQLMISRYRGAAFPSWMFAGLHSLRELSIIGCKLSSLSSLRSNGLQHLSILKISRCEGLNHLPENIVKLSFSSLRTLDISDNKNLISLCEGGGTEIPILFTTLRSLILRKCDSFNELPGWFHGITTLQSLDLSACNKLSGFQQLKSMNLISVKLCRNLATKYRSEVGEDPHGLILDQGETQQGGEQETSSKIPTRGSASNFLKRKWSSCVGGSKVHM